ncbi:MAG: RHS repeat-associated core domain-containing protein [Christensenellales bacterium]
MNIKLLPTHITYYYSDINNKTRLTSYSIDGVTFTITYDINGNPLEYYNYDVEFENGKLISLKENNQIKLRFIYDSNGKRTKKEIYNEETNTYDSVEYIYVGELLIGEKQDNQMIEYIYDEQNLVGFQITTDSVTETYYYVKNLQKDITKIIDETGKEVVSYIYDAYGNIVSTKGSKKDTIGKINPYRYRGYYYDIETGLFYCNSRYYNPEWGRWISPDSIEYLDPSSINGLNLYVYCMNDPINYCDPSGHSPEWWQWLISGVSTGLGIALCFVPGGQVFGAGLIVSGVSGLAANTMDAMGLDSELAMKIQSGLNVVGGIGLSFVPGLGGLGASMIGAGVLSFAGGYISEALGGSYSLGWGIGNIAGSIAGGMVYKGIINKLSTPSNMIKSFENHPNRWKLTGSDISNATGRNYRGGISNYSNYQNIWTRGRLGTHTITVNDIIKHFHYFFK